MTQYELYHHGILGQKWGRKQGPPYPLDPSDHSAAERKAGYRKSLGGGRNPESYRSKKAAIKKAKKDRDRAIQDRYDKEERRIESRYKRGQMLSDRDQKREAAADKRATDDWAKSKNQYKKDMIELKYQNKLDKSMKTDSEIMSARSKNRQKISDRYDKKIDSAHSLKGDIYRMSAKSHDLFYGKIGNKTMQGMSKTTAEYARKRADQLDAQKANSLKEKKAAKLKSFDAGTRYVKAGQDRYNRNIENYKNAKVKALEDKVYKKDPAYKEAVKDYTKQKLFDMYSSSVGGSQYTKLTYASDAARKDVDKKRGK